MDDLHIPSFEELGLLILMKTRLPDDPFGVNRASAMRAVAEKLEPHFEKSIC
jgi:hypothetical protein